MTLLLHQGYCLLDRQSLSFLSVSHSLSINIHLSERWDTDFRVDTRASSFLEATRFNPCEHAGKGGVGGQGKLKGLSDAVLVIKLSQEPQQYPMGWYQHFENFSLKILCSQARDIKSWNSGVWALFSPATTLSSELFYSHYNSRSMTYDCSQQTSSVRARW